MSLTRRWAALGAYVAAIYASLPFAPRVGLRFLRTAPGSWVLGPGLALVVLAGAAPLVLRLPRRHARRRGAPRSRRARVGRQIRDARFGPVGPRPGRHEGRAAARVLLAPGSAKLVEDPSSAMRNGVPGRGGDRWPRRRSSSRGTRRSSSCATRSSRRPPT